MAQKNDTKPDPAAANPPTDWQAEHDKLAKQLTALSAGLLSRDVVAVSTADQDGFDPVEAALKAIDELDGLRSGLVDELAKSKRSLTAQKGATTKAKAAIVTMQEAAKPRAIGRIDNTLEPGELLELIEDAELVEIAFSDGKCEIPGLAPARITGDAWREIMAGLKLQDVPLKVHGPAPGAPVYALEGFGLLLDGEQVAWAQRAMPRPIGPGQQYNLADDVVFQRPVAAEPEAEAEAAE